MARNEQQGQRGYNFDAPWRGTLYGPPEPSRGSFAERIGGVLRRAPTIEPPHPEPSAVQRASLRAVEEAMQSRDPDAGHDDIDTFFAVWNGTAPADVEYEPLPIERVPDFLEKS